MKINTIVKPIRKLTQYELEQYFCCCRENGVNGYDSKKHREFCLTNEPNNIINGYAWHQYLTKEDYKKYINNFSSEKTRLSLKKQILSLLQPKKTKLTNRNTRTVTGCNDCPFRYSDYDDYAIGNDTLEICTLKMQLDQQKKVNSDYFIDSYKRNETNKESFKTPEWCPLKTPLLIKLKK